MKIKKTLRGISRFFFGHPLMNEEEYDEMIAEFSRLVSGWQARDKAEMEYSLPVRLKEIAELKAKYNLEKPLAEGFPGRASFGGDRERLRIEDKEWARIAKLLKPNVVLLDIPEIRDYTQTVYSFWITPHFCLECLEDNRVGGSASDLIRTLQPEGSRPAYTLHWPGETPASN